MYATVCRAGGRAVKLMTVAEVVLALLYLKRLSHRAVFCLPRKFGPHRLRDFSGALGAIRDVPLNHQDELEVAGSAAIQSNLLGVWVDDRSHTL